MIFYAIGKNSDAILLDCIYEYSSLEEIKKEHAELEKRVPGKYKIYKVTIEEVKE